MHGQDFNESDIAQRAHRLLADFFADGDERRRRTMLALAFAGLPPDPRKDLDPSGPPADFAAACVTTLLRYGCTPGRRQALSRLLGTIREHGLGTHPDPDWEDLPRLLDAPCALPTRAEERAHLEALIADCRAKAAKYAPLAGVARRTGATPVPADWEDEDDLALIRHLRRRAGQRDTAPPLVRDYPQVLDAFAQVPRAALLGQPGAGKSTTLRRLAADRAAAALADPAAPIPVLVRLGDWTGPAPIADFLAARVPGLGDALTALEGAGRLILLLDGLNEVPSNQRADKAESIRKWLRTLAPATPVVISCRGDDYVGELDLGLDTLILQPLSPQQVRAVLIHWLTREDPCDGKARAIALFRQLEDGLALSCASGTMGDGGRADEDLSWNAEAMSRRVEVLYHQSLNVKAELWWQYRSDPRNLLCLVANPFMLGMLYGVWRAGGRVLPRNRGDLFDLFVEWLLRREGLVAAAAPDPDVPIRYTRAGERLCAGLSTLAWTMQGRRINDAGAAGADPGVLTLVPRAEAITALGGNALLKKALDATLFEGTADLRFRHQLLQEYFTARALRERLTAGTLDAAALWPPHAWWVRSGWEESAVLLAGLFPKDCTPVIRWLAEAQPEVAAQCYLREPDLDRQRDGRGFRKILGHPTRSSKDCAVATGRLQAARGFCDDTE